MKFSLVVLLTAAATAFASPSLVKRASVNDVPTVGFAALDGTTGGSGGPTVTVTTLDDLKSAVSGDDPKIVIIDANITGNEVVRSGSNKTILGRNGATLNGVGIRVLNQSNVIIRNVKIEKVLASAGDAIGIQAASKVWVDHVDLSSDRDHNKDFYDGLLDITHGCTGVTVTNSKLSDHWKASLVGHSDNNGSQDKAITVTFAMNFWTNLNSRTPSFRFGTGHIFNNVFDDNGDGINTRDGAQLLVENNVFSGDKKPLYSTDGGFAVARGNDFGGKNNTAPVGTLTTMAYSYSLIDTADVRSAVVESAGATLSF